MDDGEYFMLSRCWLDIENFKGLIKKSGALFQSVSAWRQRVFLSGDRGSPLLCRRSLADIKAQEWVYSISVSRLQFFPRQSFGSQSKLFGEILVRDFDISFVYE